MTKFYRLHVDALWKNGLLWFNHSRMIHLHEIQVGSFKLRPSFFACNLFENRVDFHCVQPFNGTLTFFFAYTVQHLLDTCQGHIHILLLLVYCLTIVECPYTLGTHIRKTFMQEISHLFCSQSFLCALRRWVNEGRQKHYYYDLECIKLLRVFFLQWISSFFFFKTKRNLDYGLHICVVTLPLTICIEWICVGSCSFHNIWISDERGNISEMYIFSQ